MWTKLTLLIYLFASCFFFREITCDYSTEEAEAVELLRQINSDVIVECNRRAVKEWNYASNITEHNRKAAVRQI